MKKSSSKTLYYILRFIDNALELLVLPLLLYRLVKEHKLYRVYTTILEKVINDNNEFYEFLEKYDFKVAWFDRLYSEQTIPDEMLVLNEDELYDVVIKALLPIRPILAKSLLIDVISPYIKRIALNKYLIILEPVNFIALKNRYIKLVVSLSLYILAAMVIMHYVA